MEQWEKLKGDKEIEAILAEHVWEHLSLEEGKEAAKNCFRFLKEGGYVRCAVPDKNFKNALYQSTIKIGGPGEENHPAANHKIVYDYKTLVKVFEEAGFEVSLLEYCDEHGDFISPVNFQERIRDTAKKLDIKFHYHMLRHTYATELMVAGVNPIVVRDLLRHSTVNTTWNVYTHPSRDDQRKVLDDLYDDNVEFMDNDMKIRF